MMKRNFFGKKGPVRRICSVYLLETHVHTAGVSACAHSTPEMVMEAYVKAGYHGMVVTNHINNQTYKTMEEKSWEEKVAHFMGGYRALCQAAKGRMDVLLGCEINLNGEGNDYLIYGVTEKWLLELGDPRNMRLKELSGRVRQDGLMIFQAHPFRYGMTLKREEWLDGVEVFNGNPNHDSHNYLTEMWAREKKLRRISGSDYHNPDSLLGAGIRTEERIRNNEELLEILRAENYQPVCEAHLPE